MSVSSDSIQTLLKQRRDLRACLEELRSEILALNFKAEKTIPDEKLMNEEVPVEVEPDAHQHLKDQVSATPEKLSSELVTPQQVVDPPIQPENVSGEGDADQVFKSTNEERDTAGASINNDHQDLIHRSRLILHHFEEHPAPTSLAPSFLENLNYALTAVEQASDGTILEGKVQSLRNAYRSVAARSYQDTGVNGETLADSRRGIFLLWLVPFYIALLTLVFFPLLLLGRSLVTRMFVTDFSSETVLVMTAVAAFLWGNVGALSYLAWGIAKRAKTATYRQGSVRDVGLRSTLGGVLGLVLYLLLFGWLPVKGITTDMVIGMGSFFAGLTSSILFGFLHTLIGNVTSKTEKKGP